MCDKKIKFLKFQVYKDCLKVAWLKKKISYLEKKLKITIDCVKRHQKDLIIKNYFEETIKISVESRNNKDFKSQRCNVYTELINKTALISNDDKECIQVI